MEALGTLISVLGLIIMIVGGIWFLVVAFQESVLWGIGCIIIPFVSLIFLVMNIDKALKPFLVQLGGGALIAIGALMSGGPPQ